MNRKSLLLLVALFLNPDLGRAAGKPRCTLDDLTNRCEAFQAIQKNAAKNQKDKVVLPDGTFFLNPLVHSVSKQKDAEAGHSHGNKPNSQAPNQEQTNLQEERLATQLDALETWNSLPAKQRVSDAFKVGFNSLPDSKGDQVWLPWPPQDPRARIQSVAMNDVIKFLDQLPKEQGNKLKSMLGRETSVGSEADSGDSRPRSKNAEPGVLDKGKLEKAFNFAKEALLEEIAKGRNPETLSGGEKIAFDRIKTAAPIFFPKNHPKCVGLMPEAEYDETMHTFLICQNMNKWPEAQVVQIIAHELSHAIDPCSMRHPLLKLNRSAIRKFSSRSETPDEVRKEQDLQVALGALESGDGEYMSLQAVNEMQNPDAINKLSKHGLFEQVAPPVEENENPYANAYKCLRDKGKFQEVTPEVIKEAARRAVESIPDFKETKEISREKLIDLAEKRLSRYPQCLRLPGRFSQMSEVMSDAWASKVLGRWLTQNPPKSEVEKLAPFAYALMDLCDNNAQPPSVRTTGDIESLASGSYEAHPPMRKRIDLIFMTEPRIQEALGCQAIESGVSCVAELGTQGAIKQNEHKPNQQPARATSKGVRR